MPVVAGRAADADGTGKNMCFCNRQPILPVPGLYRDAAISATIFPPSSIFRRPQADGKMEQSVSLAARGSMVGGRLGGGPALRLLVIEDDPDLNRQLATALIDAGYVVDRAFDGEEGHFLGESEPYDAVILDIGLPKMDGISVLEAWRRAGRAMPVLILTARDRWSDKVQGFDAGADDYVAKPFHLEEVLARIRALLRRSAGHAKSELNCGAVRLDTRTGRVTVGGNPVRLTSHEYRLLSYLMHHTGRVVSRSELVEHLYDQDFDRDSNTIEVFVGRIRKKLGVDVIQTVRGLGYLLTAAGNAP
jgi:two-component system OmpR family response regulator